MLTGRDSEVEAAADVRLWKRGHAQELGCKEDFRSQCSDNEDQHMGSRRQYEVYPNSKVQRCEFLGEGG